MSAPTHDFRAVIGRAATRSISALLRMAAAAAVLAGTASAQQLWYVSPGGSGNGSAGSPFGRIQQGLQAAQPGDTVLVAPGTYAELVSTVRPGVQSAPITVRASSGRGSVVVTRVGQVLQASHPYVVVDGLVFDAQYAGTDAVRISSAADYFVLRNAEVRRSGRDCIDMGGPDGVLIERTSINRCLWWNGRREDAHGIVAGAVHGLTIRNVDIHTFSGDGVQLDPSRSLPGWDDVLLENVTLSLKPLPSAENGFAAGMVPGENGIDTKTNGSAPRASLVIRNAVAHGFRNGLISNMAAFNIKENVDATLDGVTVSTSLIAFRLRGPGSNGGAWVHLRNAVVHDVSYGIRYEDYIEQVDVAHSTFGTGVTRVFQAANSNWAGIDVRNTVVVGSTLPTEAPASGRNMALGSSAFVSASAHDYRPAAGAPSVDAGAVIAGIDTDRAGAPRVQGAAPDLGAYERTATSTTPSTTTAPVLSGAPVATDPTNAVRLSWTNVAGETGYQVERSSDGTTFARVTTRAADSTSWTNSGLTSGRTYWYRVRAMNGTVAGAYSNVVRLALQAEGAVPSAPASLAVRLSRTRPTEAVVLSWSDTSLNEDGFYVERSADGQTFTRISTQSLNTTSYVNSGLASRVRYWYRVRAYNSLGAGAYSAVVSITTQ